MSNATIKLCNNALAINKPQMAESICMEIDDYINKYNEWGVGIELLIDNLCEEELRISLDQYKAIEEAMSAMDLGSSNRLFILRKLVKNI